MTEYRPATFDRASLPEAARFLRETFPLAHKYTPEYLEWLYLKNPSGAPVGVHVVENGTLLAQIAGIPQDIVLKGQTSRAVLLLDVAVHASLRGRGVFLDGVRETIASAQRKGFHAIIGVANQNTWRGYEKLGFQIVAGLTAWINARAPKLETMHGLDSAELFRDWTDASLTWRINNPANPLRVEAATGENIYITGRAPYPLLRAVATIPRRGLGAASERNKPSFGPSLSIELSPPESIKYGLKLLPILEHWMPSPLKLIYYNLNEPSDRLRPDAIYFSFLDFDPY